MFGTVPAPGLTRSIYLQDFGAAVMVQLSAAPVSADEIGSNPTGPLLAAPSPADLKLQDSQLQESAADHQSLITGLSRSPKHLPCSYLYDGRGSKLYDDITELEEYYLFRTEQTLLRQHARDIIAHIQPGRRLRNGCLDGTQSRACMLTVLDVCLLHPSCRCPLCVRAAVQFSRAASAECTRHNRDLRHPQAA